MLKIAMFVLLLTGPAWADAPCAAPPCAPLRIETPPRPALSQTQRLFLDANQVIIVPEPRRVAGVTVPEPEGWMLFLAGLIGLALVRRKARR